MKKLSEIVIEAFRNQSKNLVFLFFVSCFLQFPLDGIGQSDTLKNPFQKEFEEFKQQNQLEFDRFKEKNDSIFYEFLKESWVEFELMQNTRESLPKPKEQPVIKKQTPATKQITPLKPKTMLQDTGRQIRMQMGPSEYGAVEMAKPFSTIDFYGRQMKVFKANVPGFDESEISKTTIADFFETAVNNDDLTYSFYDLANKAFYDKLNGWGYLRLLQEASSSQVNKLNQQVLYTWTALLKTGYDARIGFDEKDIYLFVNFDVPVFYKLYLSKGDKKYYLIPFDGQKKPTSAIISYQADYPSKLDRLSLVLNDLPEFGQKTKSRKIEFNGKSTALSYNKYLVDFYKNYPDCDLAYYFVTPLSKAAIDGLDEIIKFEMEPLTNIEQLNLLLHFIQNSFSYQADDKQFGYENYLFAEESLYYPSIDCEDRTVLLSRLVEHYTGLKSIALAYPGHVTLAVNFPEKITGTYVMYQRQRFYVCDPTYIGATCGMLMPEFEKINPEIIVF